MTKKIIVDSCEHCPLREYQQFLGDGFKHICTHTNPSTEGMILLDISILDPDCPLEENKRSCTCHD